MMKSALNIDQFAILDILKKRFDNQAFPHLNVSWSYIEERLLKDSEKLLALYEMENTGGEPNVVNVDAKTGKLTFFDCSKETPSERRSYCYDRAALDARKKHPPQNDAMSIATNMGIKLLNEEQYFFLQSIGDFDLKTSSWLLTPKDVREKGGALFGDKRYGRCFIYHNGADSYYAARGFRGWIEV